MTLHFSVHWAVAEPRRDGFGGPVGDMLQKIFALGLNFVSQRRALTICDGGMTRRQSGARFL